MTYCVLFPAYSHAVAHVRPGLSYHLACQAMALRRATAPRGVKVYIASTPQEDVPGLWDQVRATFAEDEVLVLSDEAASLTTIAADLLARQERVVAHVQGTRQLRALAGLKQRRARRLKIVYTVHSFRNASWKRRPYSWLLARMLRKHADYALFLSPFAMQQFVGSARLVAAGRAGLMPLGVDSGDGSPLPTQAQDLPTDLAALLDDDSAFRFVYLAAFKPGKGQQWLVEAAAPVLRRHRDAVIILAGWGSEAIQSRIRRLAEKEGVAGQVVMPGAVGRNAVPWLLSRCHAGTVPSRSETFGQCIVEPMAAGLPVVGTRTGVGQWLIRDYHTGIGIGYEDREGLARAMEYLLANRNEAAAMGRNAAAAVKANLSWDDIAAAQLRLYESLLQAEHGA